MFTVQWSNVQIRVQCSVRQFSDQGPMFRSGSNVQWSNVQIRVQCSDQGCIVQFFQCSMAQCSDQGPMFNGPMFRSGCNVQGCNVQGCNVQIRGALRKFRITRDFSVTCLALTAAADSRVWSANKGRFLVWYADLVGKDICRPYYAGANMQALIMLVQIYAKYKRCSYKYMQSTRCFEKIDEGTQSYTLCGKLFFCKLFLETFCKIYLSVWLPRESPSRSYRA